MSDLYYILIYSLFFLIPLLAVVALIFNGIRYFSAKRKNKRIPGSVDSKRLRVLKIVWIVSLAVGLVLAAVVLGFVGLIYLAVAYM